MFALRILQMKPMTLLRIPGPRGRRCSRLEEIMMSAFLMASCTRLEDRSAAGLIFQA